MHDYIAENRHGIYDATGCKDEPKRETNKIINALQSEINSKIAGLKNQELFIHTSGKNMYLNSEETGDTNEYPVNQNKCTLTLKGLRTLKTLLKDKIITDTLSQQIITNLAIWRKEPDAMNTEIQRLAYQFDSAKSLPDILSGILNQDGQCILVALTAETTLINLDSKYHELPGVTKNTQPSVYNSKVDPKRLARTLNQIKFHLIETLDEEIHTLSQVSHLIDRMNHADDAQIKHFCREVNNVIWT